MDVEEGSIVGVEVGSTVGKEVPSKGATKSRRATPKCRTSPRGMALPTSSWVSTKSSGNC